MNNMRSDLLRKGIITITLLLAITTTTVYGSLGVGWSPFLSGPEVANEADITSIEPSNETVCQSTKEGTVKSDMFLYRESTKGGETILKIDSGEILNIHSLVKLNGIEWYKVLYEGSWAFVPAKDVQVEDERQTG